MVLIEADGRKYAFSTAKVPDMAKQGFTRFALHPGEEVTITGLLAPSNPTIGPEFTAARADVIAKSDGTSSSTAPSFLAMEQIEAVADVLGTFEQAVLLALARPKTALGKQAFGRAILKEVQNRLDRAVSAGAVYATLDRLEQKV